MFCFALVLFCFAFFPTRFIKKENIQLGGNVRNFCFIKLEKDWIPPVWFCNYTWNSRKICCYSLNLATEGSWIDHSFYGSGESFQICVPHVKLVLTLSASSMSFRYGSLNSILNASGKRAKNLGFLVLHSMIS